MATNNRLPRATRALTQAHKELLKLLAEAYVEQLYAEPDEEMRTAGDADEMSR